MNACRSRAVRTWILSIAVGVLVGGAVGCSDDSSDGPGPIRVVTLNVYHGFDATPLMTAADPNEIPLLAAQAYGQILANDFNERAAAMADKIALEQPHLVGLQEVALIRTQSPGDAVIGGFTPAEDVVQDSLQILLEALAARGMDYRVAGSVQNLDVELPMIVSVDPLMFDDIRLTDYDVVLSRADVAVSGVEEVTYQATAPLPNLGLEIPRGYVSVVADMGAGRNVRFVNTHLEDLPFEPVQRAQAEELVAALSAETRPVVLVGDFNSPAPEGATYAYLVEQGFRDTWLKNLRAGEGEGFTWGHDPDLRNPEPHLTMRLDLVLVKPAAYRGPRGTADAEVWGDELDERTESGLWPSDHAGVFARLFETLFWTE